MADPRIKQIKIKTGVVKRLTKEKDSYEKEAKQLEAKVEKMKADGKDEYDIKKQGEVLQESRSMVPDTIRRLKKAYDELDELLKTTALNTTLKSLGLRINKIKNKTKILRLKSNSTIKDEKEDGSVTLSGNQGSVQQDTASHRILRATKPEEDKE
ncbi:tubulin-specific chaperone A [Elysia marginata]|uniref:Tubulin-specific chaperone A n=1 Tax=Elysia marginata TaxID=1093978 RepID=A0AAV4G280_9GAST|nr:tubulin-specific chaperone A [Elysia marginata]